MSYQHSHPLPVRHEYEHEQSDSGALVKFAAVVFGLLAGVLAIAALGLWASARDARNDAHATATKAASSAPAMSMPGMSMEHGSAMAAGAGTVATPSFAGIAPANADTIAAAHRAYPAALPAIQPGPVAHVHLAIQHSTIGIAPGIRYHAWTFGDRAPGPVIHVRQGQLVHVTLMNRSPMPHSIDFHAARIAPNVAFADVQPGKSFSFSFRAGDPGVFMYHCGTKPVLAHIANGMYGAIVVSPRAGVLPRVDREYVLVAGEWYLNGPGNHQPAGLDLVKADQMTPDWVTWNGYAGQYVAHPLQAMPGQTVRFWVVDAGPSLDTDFHVVGTLLNRAWVDQDLTRFERNVQTAAVPAGGGGVFDVRIDHPGLYPVVSHSFASVNMGQVGLLRVGDVHGTMSH